jgi:hypothetical protein
MWVQMWPPPYGPGSYTGMSAVTKCDIWPEIRMSANVRRMSGHRAGQVVTQECRMWHLKCRMWHLKCRMWHFITSGGGISLRPNLECDIWPEIRMSASVRRMSGHRAGQVVTQECRMWHLKCRMWHLKCRMWHFITSGGGISLRPKFGMWHLPKCQEMSGNVRKCQEFFVMKCDILYTTGT